MTRNSYKETSQAFPEQQLSTLFIKLFGHETRLTNDDFRKVFFLFDNPASEHPCPHGSQDNVKVSYC